jgi:asparagine synthetase B (glutamine-hydrolysing)
VSGILALLHLDGRPVNHELARRLTDSMRSIGPDGRSVWAEEETALGCAAFHTVPEQPGEANPLAVDDLVVVLDGRIDNRGELRAACRGRGVDIEPEAGDGAHVLAAYRAWGLDAPAHLVGEWAFVIWDRRQRLLLAARDHMAVRSLRWWASSDTLIVCSVFRPILDHPDVRPEPDEGVIAEWLAGTPKSLDGTLWKGVSSVPGGRCLVADAGGTTPRVLQYWDRSRLLEDPIRTEDDARELMIAGVEEAVRCRMRVIGTPEIELSGGWDSSTVAVVAHDLHHAGRAGDFALSSAVYPGERHDEAMYIEAVEQHLRRAAIKRAQDLVPIEDTQQALSEIGHPWPRDASRQLPVTPTRRVTLSGDGGNETLGGMWSSAASVGLSPFIVGSSSARHSLDAFLHRVVRPRLRPHLPRLIRVARQPPLGEWLSPDLIKRTSLPERLANAEALPRHGTTRQRELLGWADFWGVHFTDLTTELDRGRYVELRHPLHDVRLFELAVRTPARFSGTVQFGTRRLHAAAFASRLPRPVTARVWGVDFDDLRRREVLQMRGRAKGCPELVARGFVTPEGLSKLDARIGSSGPVLWAASLLYAVELWMSSTSST